eukprot:scaffold88939_cov21-Phaeocystis_antarctica.AAC.1
MLPSYCPYGRVPARAGCNCNNNNINNNHNSNCPTRTLNPNPNLDSNPTPNHEQGRLGAALGAMAKAASTALE